MKNLLFHNSGISYNKAQSGINKDTITVFLFFVITLLLISCSPEARTYKLATGAPGGSFIVVGNDIGNLLNSNGFKINVLSGASYHGPANLKYLLNKQVDFAIVQNNIDINEALTKVKTVIPLYSELLFIIYKKDIKASNLKELFLSRRIGLGPKEGGSFKFIRQVLNYYNLDTTDFKPVYTEHKDNFICDSIDVSCIVSGYNNPRILAMLNKGGELFSLDDYNLLNKGSSVDGFSFDNPFAKPTVIPKNLYGDKPEKPILTLCNYTLLVTRAETDVQVVKDITKTIFENRQYLRDKNKLFVDLTDKIDNNNLKFQLHEGTVQYLERDNPSFIEKHSDLLGLSFSIMVAVGGALSGLYQWIKRKKKDRIDVFYNEVLKIKDSIKENLNEQETKELKHQVDLLKKDAYSMLIKEELLADESFRIFISLANEIEHKLENIEHRTNHIKETL